MYPTLFKRPRPAARRGRWAKRAAAWCLGLAAAIVGRAETRAYAQEPAVDAGAPASAPSGPKAAASDAPVQASPSDTATTATDAPVLLVSPGGPKAAASGEPVQSSPSAPVPVTSPRAVVPLGSPGVSLPIAPVTHVAAPSAEPPRARYFYHAYDFGSESLFNPLYVFLNRGFDILQLRPGRRNPFDQHYAQNMENVARSVAHPFSAIETRGYWKFTREEILPLSWTSTTARWVPNYGLHLVGGGMTYRELREWYEDNGVPVPFAFSALTVYAAAFVNESLENLDAVGPNTDCLADLYVFDLAGILLFSIDGVADFFSKTVTVADWSLQPSFVVPSADLHNVGNNYAATWPLPFYKPLRLFGYMGISTLGGLSYALPSGYSISVAAGARATRFMNTGEGMVANVISMKPSGAVFIDRNGSLLASAQISDVGDYFVNVNVYPNALFKTDPGIGAWAAVSREGRMVAGISVTRAFGAGIGAGHM